MERKGTHGKQGICCRFEMRVQRWWSRSFKNSHRPKPLQADMFENFTLFLFYKSRVLVLVVVFFFLHLCKCPDSVHLSFIFTVSLQDQGRFLLLHQEPGQEGRRCRGLGSSRLPPPSLLDPALLSSAAAQQVYPSPTPLNIFLDSPRRCPSLATLVSVSRVGNENRTVRDAVPVALDGVCQPLPRCG